MCVDGDQSLHSCVKYYPSAGTEVSCDHFKYRVLWRHGGGWLSGWSSVHCVASAGTSNHVTFGGRTFVLYDVLCVLTVGQEEVADLNYVTKTYQLPRGRCPLNLYTIDMLWCVLVRPATSIMHYDHIVTACIINTGAKYSERFSMNFYICLILANRKPQTHYNIFIRLIAVNFTPN